MPIIRRYDCVPLPVVVCPVVAVVMLESWVTRCVPCVENVACLRQATFSTHCTQLLITNKSLFFASSWSHLYLIIKDARSFEHKVSKYQISLKSVQCEPSCHIRTDRSTDTTKLIVVLRNFANAHLTV